MAPAQALAKLGGQVNIVYVQAASATAVGAVTGEISRLLRSGRRSRRRGSGRCFQPLKACGIATLNAHEGSAMCSDVTDTGPWTWGRCWC